MDRVHAVDTSRYPIAVARDRRVARPAVSP